MHLNVEQHKKLLYNQSSHYGKYGMLDHQSAPPAIKIKIEGKPLITMYHCVSFLATSNILGKIPNKE